MRPSPAATNNNRFVDELQTNRLYEKRKEALAGVAGARPGDVLHLDPAPATENREHNVVVRQHDVLTPSDPRWASLACGGESLMGGPVHLLDVVQSGGGSNDVRGVRHQTWLFDESTKRWGFVDPATKQITVFADGPQEHSKGDVYTPRKPAR